MVEGAGDGDEGSESRNEILWNELLRQQNNEIEVKSEAGMPRHSHSNTQVSNSSFLW